MTCKDCFSQRKHVHTHGPHCWTSDSEEVTRVCNQLEYIDVVELCQRHAMTERLAERLREYHFDAHNSHYCGKHCTASVVLADYGRAQAQQDEAGGKA